MPGQTASLPEETLKHGQHLQRLWIQESTFYWLNAYWFLYWPVGEALDITEMTQVVNITEQFILQLWVSNGWYGTILV